MTPENPEIETSGPSSESQPGIDVKVSDIKKGDIILDLYNGPAEVTSTMELRDGSLQIELHGREPLNIDSDSLNDLRRVQPKKEF